MRGRKQVMVSVGSFLLLPLLCLAQTPGPSGSPPHRPLQSTTKVVPLPAPATEGSVSVDTALGGVLNMSAPSDQSLTLSEIGQLAWAAQGRRTAAQDSNVPGDERVLLKVYFALPDGLYLYVPSSHSLQQTRNSDLRAPLAADLGNGPRGGGQIVVSGTSKDFSARYGDQARDVMLLCAGQIVQRIQLQAVALNLTCAGTGNIDTARVRRTCGFAKGIEPLSVLVVGRPAPAVPAGRPMRAVIIVPESGFADEEFFETRQFLVLNSVQVVVASIRGGPARSMRGVTVATDVRVGGIRPSDVDALIFVGGIGIGELISNAGVHRLIVMMGAQSKIVAASGNAPAILANVGVLRGVRVTCSPDVQGMVMLAGGIYTGRAVEKDGRVITSMGAGPQVVPLFAQAILGGLAGM